MTAGFDLPRRQWRRRSEQHRPLGSQPAVGLEPAALYTRHLVPVPAHEQAAFTEWANTDTEKDGPEIVARVRQLAVIAAAEQEFADDDDLFPPSPALRVKWRRVLSLALLALLAFVGTITIGHAVASHWRGAWKATYVTAAAGYLLYLTRRTDR